MAEIQMAPAEEQKQLSILTGTQDVHTLALTRLDGGTTDVLVEPFSVFKTAQVLKLLAQLRKSVDLKELFGELAELSPKQVKACPHCQKTLPPEQANLTGDVRLVCPSCLTPFPAAEMMQLSIPAKEVTEVLVSVLPKIMEVAPDLLLDFAALAILPNAELEKAYDRPNGVDILTKEKRKALSFQYRADIPFKIFNVFLPVSGMDFLLNEAVKMLGAAGLVATPAT